ncbi:hypothetical protein Tco_0569328 [Tanacetum coccineum]
MVDLIYVPGVDSHQLRMRVFHLSLADNAKEWWISEGDGKITTWEELVEKLFCRFYPESYDREDEMLDEGENWGIDPLDFLSNVNTSFKSHKKVDRRTQKVIFHSWMNENWNKRYVDNTYDVRDIGKENVQGQMKRKDNDKDDKRPHKKICKTEKFEAIKYSLGPNEEYLAIRRCEYDIWERNEDSISKIYQEIFQKKDDGWKITRME